MGIEPCGTQQAQLGENGRQHLLRLVDDQHRPRQRGIDVGLPALAQHLGAGPAVVGAEFDAEQVAHLAIEVGEVGLGPAAHAHLDVMLLREPLGENAQGNRLAGAGSPGDEGEAAFANQLLDAPAERLDAPRDMERFDRHVGRKRIPFEAIEREQLLIHVSSPCASFGR
jgi:hypothetical protein